MGSSVSLKCPEGQGELGEGARRRRREERKGLRAKWGWSLEGFISISLQPMKAEPTEGNRSKKFIQVLTKPCLRHGADRDSPGTKSTL